MGYHVKIEELLEVQNQMISQLSEWGDTIRVRLSGIRNDCSNTLYPRGNWEKHTKLYTRSTYSCD